MSFVVTTPEWMQSAAQELAAIRSALIEAATSAAAPTVSVLPAGADEISGVLAAMFGNLGQQYHAAVGGNRIRRARYQPHCHSADGGSARRHTHRWHHPGAC